MPEGEEEDHKIENLFEKIMKENFSNLDCYFSVEFYKFFTNFGC